MGTALLCGFFQQLYFDRSSYARRSLASSGVVVVFIAAEEGGEKEIGVDAVLKNGKLEEAPRPTGGFSRWVMTAVLGFQCSEMFCMMPILLKGSLCGKPLILFAVVCS